MEEEPSAVPGAGWATSNKVKKQNSLQDQILSCGKETCNSSKCLIITGKDDDESKSKTKAADLKAHAYGIYVVIIILSIT